MKICLGHVADDVGQVQSTSSSCSSLVFISLAAMLLYVRPESAVLLH